MSFHVIRQMIGSRERSIALATLERLDARVLSIVSLQFVGAHKSPRTSFPSAFVRFLARVRLHVRLQVRTLRVDFAAADVRAAMNATRRLQLTTVVDVVAVRQNKRVKRVGSRRCQPANGRESVQVHRMMLKRQSGCLSGGGSVVVVRSR